MIRRAQVLLATAFLFVPSILFAQIRAVEVASGFEQPVAVVADPHAPTGSETLIVVEQRGTVHALVNGRLRPDLFVDLTAEVQFLGEQGMLGLAFHPTDANRVFVSFSRRRTPDDEMSDTVIARFNRSAADPLVLDPASRVDFLWPGDPETRFIPQPSAVHKGGALHFREDNGHDYLYVGLGDGGSANFPAGFGHAQDPSSLLGKFLRLDVDVDDSDLKGYRVPADNPFVPYQQQFGVLGEIWSFGFRNPWRWSFDNVGPGATGAMVIGDVGEFDREEIDYEPAGAGGRNYGWFVMEGSIPTPGRRPSPPAFEPLTPPIADYPRTIGRSVTGGFVYRGSELPARYQGRYFLADYFGRIFSLGLAIAPSGEAQVTDYLEHTAELGSPRRIPTFGRGVDGELYFTNFDGGRVLKIVPSPIEPPAPPVAMGEVSGSTVRISWQNGATGGSPTSFILEAGSAPSQANLLRSGVGYSPLVVSGVPNGRYFVRVLAVNDLGTSEPSNEVEVMVGCTAAPAVPAGVTADVDGPLVSLAWSPAAGATSYLIDAGSGPGQTDIATIPATGTSFAGPVPPATYYVRVRAVNQCGASAPSAEITVVVP